MTYWIVGLNVLGIASIAAGLNFIVTILNMRAPGMDMFKLPVFTWMTLVTSVLIVLALPILAVAGIQLQTDRIYGTHFLTLSVVEIQSCGNTFSGYLGTLKFTF